MGYPQANTVNIQPPPTHETVTMVLADSFGRLNELERKLCEIRDRIESRPPTLEKGTTLQPQQGTLHLSMDIRNATVRLMERCAEIDMLL